MNPISTENLWQSFSFNSFFSNDVPFPAGFRQTSNLHPFNKAVSENHGCSPFPSLLGMVNCLKNLSSPQAARQRSVRLLSWLPGTSCTFSIRPLPFISAQLSARLWVLFVLSVALHAPTVCLLSCSCDGLFGSSTSRASLLSMLFFVHVSQQTLQSAPSFSTRVKFVKQTLRSTAVPGSFSLVAGLESTFNCWTTFPSGSFALFSKYFPLPVSVSFSLVLGMPL
mmetsp:Transcript_11617/g.71452  ORF Transcript_11617/g.71452 Transcript_11617/m.71452 type:complete len:224 (-) Transcript_11617:1640-2311(-)